jgi:hypothetical protein
LTARALLTAQLKVPGQTCRWAVLLPRLLQATNRAVRPSIVVARRHCPSTTCTAAPDGRAGLAAELNQGPVLHDRRSIPHLSATPPSICWPPPSCSWPPATAAQIRDHASA